MPPGLLRWECAGRHAPRADNTFRFELEDKGGGNGAGKAFQVPADG